MKLLWLISLLTFAACQDSNKSMATGTEEAQQKNKIRQQLTLDPTSCMTPEDIEEYASVLKQNISAYEEMGTLDHCL